MKFSIFYFLIAMFYLLNASIVVGKVELLKGTIKVKREDSIKKKRVFSGFIINSGDLVVSSKNSNVKIKLNDGSVLVLDEKSSVHLNSMSSIEQKNGKILYKITSRDARNSLKIKTPFAIIGIKGTTFIVNSREDSAYISLKEGLIGVESLKEEFELYRHKIQKEFDDYVVKQENEFEKFKNAHKKYAEVQYTKAFDLKEGHHISFNEQRVKEDFIIDKYKEEFEYFEQIINDIK